MGIKPPALKPFSVAEGLKTYHTSTPKEQKEANARVKRAYDGNRISKAQYDKWQEGIGKAGEDKKDIVIKKIKEPVRRRTQPIIGSKQFGLTEKQRQEIIERREKQTKLDIKLGKARTRQAEQAQKKGRVDRAIEKAIDEKDNITVDEFTKIMKSYFILPETPIFKTYFKRYGKNIRR